MATVGRPLLKVSIEQKLALTKGELALLAMPGRLLNLRALMKDGVATSTNRMLKAHWDSQGRKFGHAWAPLMESTIARKRRKGTLERGILHSSNNLFKKLFAERDADSRLRAVPGGLRLALNTAVPYAIYHQVGTSHMTEREVIPSPLPQTFIREVKSLVYLYLRTGRTSAGA